MLNLQKVLKNEEIDFDLKVAIADNLSSKRVECLDILKGIAIILVVIRHVMQANITDCSTTIIGNMIFAVQMPLFMLVAGYFSVTNEKYYGSIKQSFVYIGKRFVHYMLPFFTWFAIVYVFVRGAYGRNIIFAFSELISNVDIGLWFLYVVFILSTVLILSKYFCNKIIKSKQVNGFFALLGAGVLLFPFMAVAYFKGSRFLGANQILYYFLYFALGSFLFEYRNIVVKVFGQVKVQVVLFCLSTACFVGICIFHNIELSEDSLFNIVVRVIAAITGCTSIAIATKWISGRSTKVKKILAFIGRYTLEIYVVHLQFIGLLPKGTYYTYTLDGLGIFTLAFAITAVCTTLTIILMKKVRFLNLLFFGKLMT